MGGVAPEQAGDLVRSAPWQSLRRLMLLRNIAIAGQTFAIAAVHEFFAVPSPLAALVSVAGLLVLLNLAATSWRLRQPKPVTDLEVLAQVLIDVSALTVLLYLSGGAANPFAGMFLMPLAIAAASLPWTHTLIVALLTAASYSLLIFFHVPLPVPGRAALEFLVFAAWLNYLLCAGLIAYLVLSVAGRLREQNRRLAEIKRSTFANGYLVRVGSLAAGAAHEIKSPLCTMAVLVEEMLQGDDHPTLKQNLRIMSDQIEVCRRTLSDLAPGGEGTAFSGSHEPADKFVQDLVDRFRILRPGIELSFRWSGTRPSAMISADRDFGRGIVNLLNNAADASPGAVEMNCRSSSSELSIRIEDRGPGIPSELEDVDGETVFTTKGDKGTGIGLLLARVAVARAGGKLNLSRRPGGGTRAEVVLTLAQPADAYSVADRDSGKTAVAGPELLTGPVVPVHGSRR